MEVFFSYFRPLPLIVSKHCFSSFINVLFPSFLPLIDSRQIYYDYIEGKSSQSENIYQKKTEERKIALHEKILKEYLEKMGEVTEAARSINWVTHQKCKDMFILSKVRTNEWTEYTTHD